MSKRWVFTWNCWNHHPDPDTNQLKLPWIPSEMNFLICQWEHVQHDHLQGYVEFKKRRTLVQIKKWLPGAHLEVAKGSPDDNIKYCSKEESRVAGPWDFGQPMPFEPGARNDLGKAYDLAAQGAKFGDIAEAMPSVAIRYHRGLEKVIESLAPKRSWCTAGVVIVGIPGIGKSRAAHQLAPDAYDKQDGKWWDGYTGQEKVIWDDFNPKETPYRYLLKLLDRYPMSVEVKGGHVQMMAKVIYFTTNHHPDTWYPGEMWDALKRRISVFIMDEQDYDPHGWDALEDDADASEIVNELFSGHVNCSDTDEYANDIYELTDNYFPLD